MFGVFDDSTLGATTGVMADVAPAVPPPSVDATATGATGKGSTPCKGAADKHEADDKFLSLIKCMSCGEEPRLVVESPCCGQLWCWECVARVLPSKCSLCSGPLSLEVFRPAKSIERLITQMKETSQPETPCNLTFTCPQGCGAIVPIADLEDHLHDCSAEVSCPNGCFTQVLQKDLSTHLQNTCPLTFINCGYGCEEQFLRRESEDHMEENVHKHIDKLLSRVQAQEKLTKEADEKRAAKRARPLLKGFTQMAPLLLFCILAMVGLVSVSYTMSAMPVQGHFSVCTVVGSFVVVLGASAYLFSLYCALF